MIFTKFWCVTIRLTNAVQVGFILLKVALECGNKNIGDDKHSIAIFIQDIQDLSNVTSCRSKAKSTS